MGSSIVYTLHAVYTPRAGWAASCVSLRRAVTGGRCSGPRPLENGTGIFRMLTGRGIDVRGVK